MAAANPKVTVKNGVTCTKQPSHFVFQFTETDATVALVEKTRNKGFYPLLLQLNKDAVADIKVTPAGDQELVLLTLFMNYFDDGDEDLNVLLPLCNTTPVARADRVEIHGRYDTTFRQPGEQTVVKIAMFQVVLDQPVPQGELKFTLELRLAEPMNVLRENTICLVLQKILGRLKTHLVGGLHPPCPVGV